MVQPPAGRAAAR